MKIIPSTKGFEIICDDDDYERLSGFRWYAHHHGKGRNRDGEYRPARRDSAPPRKVHTFVHAVMGRAPDGMVIDHINGNPWDNRKENLRICSHGQNLRNQRRPRKANGTGKGVHIVNGSITVKISFRYETFCFVGWNSVAEAERIYDALALHLHGDFACLNHPDEGTTALSPEQVRAILTQTRAGRSVEAKVIPLLRDGLNATEASRLAQCAISTVSRIAQKHGIKLARGRPRKIAA